MRGGNGRKPRVLIPFDRRHLLRDLDDEEPAHGEEPPAAFPWPAVITVLALIAFHMAVVFLTFSPLLDRRWVLSTGGIVPESTWTEPWRLVSSMFLHSGPSHVFWNGVSMLVFAVPLLSEIGQRKVWSIYLAAGIGGGLSALVLAAPSSVTIGSSGAVAGLFGAWVGRGLRLARFAAPSWRARVRTFGIMLLVLPAFLTPTTGDGRRISVAAHIGGLLVGLLAGLASGRGASEAPPEEPEPETLLN